MLDNLTEDTAVAATNDKDLLGAGVREHGQVGDHLLVGELITLSALDDIVEDKDITIVGGLEDEDILVLALLVVQDLLDLEGHSLAFVGHTVLDRNASYPGLGRSGPNRQTRNSPGHMLEISRNHPSAYSI